MCHDASLLVRLAKVMRTKVGVITQVWPADCGQGGRISETAITVEGFTLGSMMINFKHGSFAEFRAGAQ